MEKYTPKAVKNTILQSYLSTEARPHALLSSVKQNMGLSNSLPHYNQHQHKPTTLHHSIAVQSDPLRQSQQYRKFHDSQVQCELLTSSLINNNRYPHQYTVPHVSASYKTYRKKRKNVFDQSLTVRKGGRAVKDIYDLKDQKKTKMCRKVLISSKQIVGTKEKGNRVKVTNSSQIVSASHFKGKGGNRKRVVSSSSKKTNGSIGTRI